MRSPYLQHRVTLSMILEDLSIVNIHAHPRSSSALHSRHQPDLQSCYQSWVEHLRGWAVIESNPAWGSGLYGCDLNQVLGVLQRACLKSNGVTEADAQ